MSKKIKMMNGIEGETSNPKTSTDSSEYIVYLLLLVVIVGFGWCIDSILNQNKQITQLKSKISIQEVKIAYQTTTIAKLDSTTALSIKKLSSIQKQQAASLKIYGEAVTMALRLALKAKSDDEAMTPDKM
jgi:hypothetical protein